MVNSNLTIGIPCYNCLDTIEKTLQSINIQNEKPYEVIFCDDASTQDYKKILKHYSFLNIRYIRLEKNSGVGAVRAKIVNEAKTKFLTMIDSDDRFYSVDVIEFFHEQIRLRNFDMLITNFIQELPDNENIIFGTPFIGCHGKIYNLDFLKQQNINFPPLRAHEEGFINRSIALHGDVLKNEKVTYFWHWNLKGITRKDDVMYKYFLDYVESVRLNSLDKRYDLVKPLITIYTYYDKMIQIYGEKDKKLKNYKQKILEIFNWDYNSIKDFIQKNRKDYKEAISGAGGNDYIPHKNILKFLKENGVE